MLTYSIWPFWKNCKINCWKNLWSQRLRNTFFPLRILVVCWEICCWGGHGFITRLPVFHHTDECKGLREFNYCAVFPACCSLFPSGQGKTANEKTEEKLPALKKWVSEWVNFPLHCIICLAAIHCRWCYIREEKGELHLVFISPSISLQHDEWWAKKSDKNTETGWWEGEG